MFKKIAFTTFFTSALLLAQSGVGVNINENDLEVEGVLDSRNLAALQTSSTIYQADFNFLNNNNDKKLFGAGLGATNKLEGVEGVELTFGAKFMWSEVGNDDFTALPLMAKIRYSFPPLMYNIPPVGVEAKALYAPGALAFGDSEKYSELRISADIEMIENVKIYTGYRNIHTGYKGDEDHLFDNSFYGGLKITY
ncbi:YfaZ family protein [bacterium]|nr:YfaZ family protein [bacterium]MBU1959309.1 YfaZ family protein [bacterium]